MNVETSTTSGNGCFQALQKVGIVHHRHQIVFEEQLELVEISAGEHNDRGSDAVAPQLDGFFDDGNAEGVATFSRKGSGDRRRAVTVAIGFDHGKNLNLGAEQRADLTKIPAQRFMIDVANTWAAHMGAKLVHARLKKPWSPAEPVSRGSGR